MFRLVRRLTPEDCLQPGSCRFLSVPEGPARPFDAAAPVVLVVTPVVDPCIAPALELARTLGGEVRALLVGAGAAEPGDAFREWVQLSSGEPLVTLESGLGTHEPVSTYLRESEVENAGRRVVVILAEPELSTSTAGRLLLDGGSLRTRTALLASTGVTLCSVRCGRPIVAPAPGQQPDAPARAC